MLVAAGKSGHLSESDMSSRPTGIGFAVIVVSFLFFNQLAVAQQCHSCLDDHQVYQVDGLASCGQVACLPRHVAGLGCFQEFCDHVAHLREINRVVSNRNQAWPKPFACADRQLYFQMWDPMLETGWKSACVFSQRHFVGETAELNQAGRMKIAAIMRNFPIGQKAFLLEPGQSRGLLEERLAALKNTVENLYGLEQVAEIGVADVVPLKGSGSACEKISEAYQASLPGSLLPSSSDTQSSATNLGQ